MLHNKDCCSFIRNYIFSLVLYSTWLTFFSFAWSNPRLSWLEICICICTMLIYSFLREKNPISTPNCLLIFPQQRAGYHLVVQNSMHLIANTICIYYVVRVGFQLKLKVLCYTALRLDHENWIRATEGVSNERIV